jgi:hypothetical protein
MSYGFSEETLTMVKNPPVKVPARGKGSVPLMGRRSPAGARREKNDSPLKFFWESEQTPTLILKLYE